MEKSRKNSKMKKKILVIAAHPDDETLGCGGTIARLVKNNHVADVVFLSSGVGAKKTINSKIKRSKSENLMQNHVTY